MADDIDRLLKTIDDAIARGHSPQTVWDGVGAIFDAHRPKPLPPEGPSPLEEAAKGTLRVTRDSRGIWVCGDDGRALMAEGVAGYEMFVQFVCPECGKIALADTL
jgi:hypothetical protein